MQQRSKIGEKSEPVVLDDIFEGFEKGHKAEKPLGEPEKYQLVATVDYHVAKVVLEQFRNPEVAEYVQGISSIQELSLLLVIDDVYSLCHDDLKPIVLNYLSEHKVRPAARKIFREYIGKDESKKMYMERLSAVVERGVLDSSQQTIDAKVRDMLGKEEKAIIVKEVNSHAIGIGKFARYALTAVAFLILIGYAVVTIHDYQQKAEQTTRIMNYIERYSPPIEGAR